MQPMLRAKPVNKSTNENAEKVLLIRMLSSADVCAIGLPVLRYFQKTLPNADIHFLTFGDGAQLIKLAEPTVEVKYLTKEQWPDDFFSAMESFLGQAEQIIGDEYSQIVNLDTAFMPCFLARFLMDAGEPVSGNFLNMSVQQLLSQVQTQSLEAEYVNSTPTYMASSFMNMHKWHSNWWQSGAAGEGGYPEFYLNKCCGLDVDGLEQSITISPDKRLTKKSKVTKVIGLCLNQSDDGYLYPFSGQLKKALEQKGFEVWTEQDAQGDIRTLLKMLTASDLMVSKPSGHRWYAQAVGCPTLLISGDSEPAILMPEFATDPTSRCLQHGIETTNQQFERCNCDQPADLVESIESVVVHLEEQGDD